MTKSPRPVGWIVIRDRTTKLYFVDRASTREQYQRDKNFSVYDGVHSTRESARRCARLLNGVTR